MARSRDDISLDMVEREGRGGQYGPIADGIGRKRLSPVTRPGAGGYTAPSSGPSYADWQAQQSGGGGGGGGGGYGDWQRRQREASWTPAPDPVGNPNAVVRSKFDAEKGQSLASFYDDSYGRMLGALAAGGQGGDIFQDVLRNFRGGISDLQRFLESPAAKMGLVYGIQNSPEWQQSRDFSAFDNMFQAGAGDIATQTAEAQSRGARAAARSGQGRNAALKTALASQAGMAGAQGTATLRGQIQMQKLQQAQRAFEQQRQLAALATGQITPRVEKEGGDETMDWVDTAANVADIFI